MPAAILGSLLVTIWNEMAYTQNWWDFNIDLIPIIVTNVSFIYGVFLIGTLWIFYFTYRNFWLYLLTNIAVDGFLAFPANYVFEQIGLYRMMNYSGWYIWLTATALSIVLYVYHRWQEGVFVKDDRTNRKLKLDPPDWFQTKEKAR